jgi:hypothetical protein
MMEAVRTSETSVDNYFTRQYIPEDNSEHHTHRRENLKSHKKTKKIEKRESTKKRRSLPEDASGLVERSSERVDDASLFKMCHNNRDKGST